MPIPYATIEFTKTGTPADEAQIAEALAMLQREQATDVLVLSHGWNNDMRAAERLYSELIENMDALRSGDSSTRPAVIGILWPSIRWADDDQIAGGGVSVEDEDATLAAAIDEAVEDPETAASLHALTERLGTAEGRAEFVALARGLWDERSVTDDEDAVPAALRSGDPETLFEAVQDAEADMGDVVAAREPSDDAAPGVAPDLLADESTSGAGLFGMSWKSLARQVLNTFTYYTMKARAGDVGTHGVAPLIDRVNDELPGIRVHLAGHSFGARVVSSAATEATRPIQSLTLLQGAFSHYGFTEDYAGTAKDGAFVPAITSGRIGGPVVITHTHNDKAVRLAYAIASRLARQVGAAVGDASDIYGGIGANGSVGTPAVALAMVPSDDEYALTDGRIHNLLADEQIANHGDVKNPAVANLVLHAMGLR